jgi:mycothiol S-conjugate amidase
MTSYDERGGYPHPDHIACHLVSMEAFRAAADPARYPDAGEPWQVAKLYFHHTFNRPRAVAISEAMEAAGLPSPYAERLKEWTPDPAWDARITTRVPCAEWFETRDRALLAHATQIDPDGFWFAVPMEVQQATWPHEDYELVESHVPTDLPENDLFAGLRDGVWEG